MPVPAPVDIRPGDAQRGVLPDKQRPNPTPLRVFTTGTGRVFTVRVLPAATLYGRTGKLFTDRVLVEFYDATYADSGHATAQRAGFGPLGQLVSRYYYADMIDHTGGLVLDDDPVWQIDAATMRVITRWLATRHVIGCVASKSYPADVEESERPLMGEDIPDSELDPAAAAALDPPATPQLPRAESSGIEQAATA